MSASRICCKKNWFSFDRIFIFIFQLVYIYGTMVHYTYTSRPTRNHPLLRDTFAYLHINMRPISHRKTYTYFHLHFKFNWTAQLMVALVFKHQPPPSLSPSVARYRMLYASFLKFTCKIIIKLMMTQDTCLLNGFECAFFYLLCHFCVAESAEWNELWTSTTTNQ